MHFRSTCSIYLMTSLTIYMFIKTCFFIRIFKKFGLLVNLVETCIVDIIPFTIFMAQWMFCFYLLYKVTGIESPDRIDQLGEHKNIQDFFYIWSNSIGDIHYWAKSTIVSNEYVMYLMSFIWFFNQFYVVIILLNFLIAVIS